MYNMALDSKSHFGRWNNNFNVKKKKKWLWDTIYGDLHYSNTGVDSACFNERGGLKIIVLFLLFIKLKDDDLRLRNSEYKHYNQGRR